jgi:3-deoxy-manno-octulosonate cytidylyltransferase (CMP-KDO synthetase)
VDSDELASLLRDAGFDATLTDPNHSCGTDRIAEANNRIRADFVINVQADEPMVTGRQVRQLAALIQSDVEMATLGSPLESEADYLNPNHVKCFADSRGRAIYFSRAPIPHFRDTKGRFDARRAADCGVMIHLGLYAYRREFLATFASMAQTPLEQLEKLEMLRALENGCSIALGRSDDALIEIDTAEQAAQFERYIADRLACPAR